MIETVRTSDKTEARQQSGPYRVMVVDDSVVIRGLLARAIEDLMEISRLAVTINIIRPTALLLIIPQ